MNILYASSEDVNQHSLLMQPESHMTAAASTAAASAATLFLVVKHYYYSKQSVFTCT